MTGFERIIRGLPLCLALLLGGCSSLGYYAQSAQGQLALMASAEPIDAVLADPATSAELAAQLRQVQAIRRFAVERLALPDNGSYRDYADVQRDALVWSVVATGEFSLQPRQWCFPVVGCTSYRGYFDRQQAEAFAAKLQAAGDDVAVLPVPAYSTLGWFDDPLPSTVIWRDEATLAGLIFHELAHQRVYVPDDSTFNESYASAVEEIGVELWLAGRSPQSLKAWHLRRQREAQMLRAMSDARDELAEIYRAAMPLEVKRLQKQQVFDELQQRLWHLQMARNGAVAGTGLAREPLNNAYLAMLQTYNRWVPAFKVLWQRMGGDAPAFHRAVEALAALPKTQREQRLQALSPAGH